MTVSKMKGTSYIRLLNKKLERSGFRVGEKFEVVYGRDRILIKKVENEKIHSR